MSDTSEPWRPMSRFDVRLGRRQLVRVAGVEQFVTPIAIEELPLPCDLGARAVLSLRLDDDSVLTGVRLDRLEVRDRPDGLLTWEEWEWREHSIDARSRLMQWLATKLSTPAATLEGLPSYGSKKLQVGPAGVPGHDQQGADRGGGEATEADWRLDRPADD